MFTECDYLVQLERHKDYVAYAERYRQGEAHLPRGMRGVIYVGRIAERLRNAVNALIRPSHPATRATLGKSGV